jgi:prevent-host-death family protein
MTMRTIAAAEFKAKCLQIMDDVRDRRESVTITKKGRAVAKLVPIDEAAREVFGCLIGILEIAGDITGPVAPASAWRGSS